MQSFDDRENVIRFGIVDNYADIMEEMSNPNSEKIVACTQSLGAHNFKR